MKKSINDGHDVIGLRLPNHFEKINIPKSPTWVTGSIEDDLRQELDGCDVLIHLAAYGVNPKYNSWQESFRLNVAASLNLWKQAHQVGVKKIIIAGSCYEYGKSAERYEYIPCDAPLEPVNAYGASKAAATIAAMSYARENDLEIAVLRLFHVYGEGEGAGRFWPSMKKAALEGKDFLMTSGEQIRDFTPVEIVAEKFLEFATKLPIEPGNPIIQNIGTGRPQSLVNFAQKYWDIFEAKGRLMIGKVPYRKSEIMRYVPQV